MNAELTEQEQLDQVKKWLVQYGPTILITAILTLILSFGWHRWHFNKERALEHASIRYEQLLTDLEHGNKQAANDIGEYLIKRYPKTAYAPLAKLLQARIAIENSQFELANSKFDWVIKQAKSAPVKQMARIRKARLLLALNQPRIALDTLKNIDDSGFIALTESVKGDCYVVLKQLEAARIAYQTALRNLPENQNIGSLIRMKLDNLTTGTPL